MKIFLYTFIGPLITAILKIIDQFEAFNDLNPKDSTLFFHTVFKHSESDFLP